MAKPSAVNRAILDDKKPVYVFAEFWAGMDSVNGCDSIKTKYAAKTARAITHKGVSYPIEHKRLGCGVYTVPCVFVKEI